MHKNLWIQRFHPDREFVARVKMVINGQALKPGDELDKSLVTVRRLRQMYDMRKIMTKQAWELHHGPKAVVEGTPDDEGGGNPTEDPANASPGSPLEDGGASEGGEGAVETPAEPESQPETPAEPEEAPKVDDHPAAGVVISDDWKSLLAEPMKELAKQITGDKPDTKYEAEAVIEKELQRRGELS